MDAAHQRLLVGTSPLSRTLAACRRVCISCGPRILSWTFLPSLLPSLQTLRGLLGYAMSMLEAPSSTAGPAQPLSQQLLQLGDDTTSNVRATLSCCPSLKPRRLSKLPRRAWVLAAHPPADRKRALFPC
jgi:hypothetical protein